MHPDAEKVFERYAIAALQVEQRDIRLNGLASELINQNRMPEGFGEGFNTPRYLEPGLFLSDDGTKTAKIILPESQGKIELDDVTFEISIVEGSFSTSRYVYTIQNGQVSDKRDLTLNDLF
jgi:hypothetical protein